MSNIIVEKYLLRDLYSTLTKIENEVLGIVKNENVLGMNDDVDLLVPALTSSLSLLRQIIILCENGFPDGALILARNIYEQRVICSFIEEHEDVEKDELLKKYFQSEERTRLEYINDQSKRFNDIEYAEKTDKLINEHKNNNGSSYNQYWWSGKKTFKDISAYVIKKDNVHTGLYNNMHMEYKLACLVAHPSCFGNKINIGSSYGGIDMQARINGQENALFLAVSSLIPLVGYTYHYLQLDEELVLNELNKMGIYYLQILQS